MSEISIIDSYGDIVVVKRDDLKALERQLELAKVNERDLNDIITALNEELSEKERRFKVYKAIAEEAIEVTPTHFDEGYGWSDSIEKVKRCL